MVMSKVVDAHLFWLNFVRLGIFARKAVDDGPELFSSGCTSRKEGATCIRNLLNIWLSSLPSKIFLEPTRRFKFSEEASLTWIL